MRELTYRQTQIAELVAAGLTMAEVGERLGISRHTVKNTKTTIFHKLGVRNAVELANRMRRA